jgi:hypothetical protein
LAEKKAASLAYRTRRALIEAPADSVPLGMQAALLNISRTHLYYRAALPSAGEVAIKHRSDELFTACPFYGSRKMEVLLEPTFGSIARNTQAGICTRSASPQSTLARSSVGDTLTIGSIRICCGT